MTLIPEIQRADCLEWLAQIPSGVVDLAFADPPFNQGFEYEEYEDTRDPLDYTEWCQRWIAELHRVLKPNGTCWLASGDAFVSWLDIAATVGGDLSMLGSRKAKPGFNRRSWVVWYYTFGVNCVKNFTKSHTHLLYYTKHKSNFTFNSDDPAVRHASARQLVYKDKRADPTGRLPDNTWFILEQQIAELLRDMDDVWLQPRVNGTFKERMKGQSCQMPKAVMERIIRLTSNPGDLVIDPFLGSGVTCQVAQELGRRSMGCDIGGESVKRAKQLCGVTD